MLTRRSLLQALLGSAALAAAGRSAGGLPANKKRRPLLVGIGGAGCNVLAQCGWTADAGIPRLGIDSDTRQLPPGAVYVDAADAGYLARQLLRERQRLLLVFADGGGAVPSGRTGSRVGRVVLAAAHRAGQLAGAVIITPFAWEGIAGVSPAAGDWLTAMRRLHAAIAVVENAAVIDDLPGDISMAAAFQRINQLAARRLAQLATSPA